MISTQDNRQASRQESRSAHRSETGTTRILLADDHAIFRAGLRQLIAGVADFQIVGEAANGKELLDQLDQVECDLVILDLSMPELDGLKAIEEIQARHAGVEILVLTMHKDREYFSRAISRGVGGYLLKDDVFEELVAAIHDIRAGKKKYSGAIQAQVMEDYATIRENEIALDLLSRRELEVLKLIASGKMNKDIAKDLKISIRTVESHRAKIMDKLDLRNVADLVRFAVARALV
ncbi:MAG: response regulator transcription factor [bacterium]|nr:response regulator transcription factor [bacterium]